MSREQNRSARPDGGTAAIFVLAFAVLVVEGLTRWLRDPSFWLDEAYIAMNLKGSLGDLFSPLLYGQWFPRLYLAAIGLVQGWLGPSTKVLRLLPFSCFLAASGLSCLILFRLFGRWQLLSLLALGLLISTDVWILQAASLKQYTFDVMLGLIPFVLPDRFFRRLLEEPGGQRPLFLLTLPLALSYSYSIPLAGRIMGCILHGRADRRRGARQAFSIRRLALFAAASIFWMGLLYVTDLRFDSRSTVAGFWSGCVLRDQLAHPQAMLMPLLRLFFAWYLHTLPAAFSVPLGLLLLVGMGRVAWGWTGRRPSFAGHPMAWAAIPSGSLVTLAGLVTASLLAGYPICRGRLTLFVMLHVQILILLGACMAWSSARFRMAARGAMILLVVGLVPMALRAANTLRLQPAKENLRPLLARLDVSRSSVLFIHDCSLRQWRTLPEKPLLQGIPLDGNQQENLERLRAARGPVWLLWTHQIGPCGERLEGLRQAATTWNVVYEGNSAGLALAEYFGGASPGKR
ncbi:MAG: hypothetical protein ACE5ID_02965, partial [Acidobacteriota bacterium]